jgi:uncharacterized Zn finger protein (UPF0148 family)
MAGALPLAIALFAGVPTAADDPPPTMVALALDTSGSIGAVQLARTRDLALEILAALPAGSEVAVLAFDDQSRVVVPRTSQAEEVRQRLSSLAVAGRHTALHDALYDASRYLRDAPGLRKAIVLITDGVDENSALNLEDGLKLAQESSIPVFAVAIGVRPRERVLRRIAKLTAGEYLPFDRAQGRALAAQIAALPPVAPTEAPATSSAAAPGSAARPAATGAAPPRAAPRLTTRNRAVWAALVLTILAAAAALVIVRRLSRPAVSCPKCGLPLPAGAESCPSCVTSEAAALAADSPAPARARAPRLRDPVPELSDTVMSRLSTTEEYLENTMVLLHRPVLAVTKGPGLGEVYELSASSATSIGRSRANDIQVNDVSVSGQHCRVRPEDGKFVLHDLQSTNGTLVNEKTVTRHVLQEGDVITIGETALQFRREMKRG